MAVEFDTRRISQASDCRSFGGAYNRSSQSRKMSIGIMIDSLQKKQSEAVKDVGVVAGPYAERGDAKEWISSSDKTKSKGVISPDEGRQKDNPEQVSSPWISTRSAQRETPELRSPMAGKQNKLNRAKKAQLSHATQFFSGELSTLHSADANLKKFGTITYQRKANNGENLQRKEELSFVPAQEEFAPDKAAVEGKTESGRTETLRMKLWEILGAVSSQRNQNPDSQAHGAGDENLNSKQKLDQKIGAAVNQGHNSDTIEPDSESHERIVKKKPTGCSATRKKASTKTKVQKGKKRNAKAAPSSIQKQKLQESIFSGKEQLLGKGNATMDGDTSLCTQKKPESNSKNASKILLTKNIAESILGATHRSETSVPAEKTSSDGNKTRSSFDFSPQNEKMVQTKKKTQARDSLHSWKVNSEQSLGAKGNYQNGKFTSTVAPKNGVQEEEFGDPSSKNVLDLHDDFKSPTFKMDTPILSSSPLSTPETGHIKKSAHSPTQTARKVNVGNIRSFKNLFDSKANFNCSDPQIESTDVEAEFQDSPLISSPLEDKNDKHRAKVVDDEDSDNESSEEDSPFVKGYKNRNFFSTETAKVRKSKVVPNQIKRPRNHEGSGVPKSTPAPAFRFSDGSGIGESVLNPEASEQYEGDESERVIMLFVSALENFKKKIKIAAGKKSSEILMSVSQQIHQKLQSLESQIQTDLGKLTSGSKSKRKRLEAKFDGHQEQLQSIYMKFKQEIEHNIQECKSTLEELEVYRTELKGNVKKQKASHKKLLMQAEEAIETQLNDAEKRITAVHKLARNKMLQLQGIVAECFKDGVLN